MTTHNRNFVLILYLVSITRYFILSYKSEERVNLSRHFYSHVSTGLPHNN